MFSSNTSLLSNVSSSSNRLKIVINELKEGMFIADLDCPWHQTPFPLQGFYIRNDDDIKALAQYCRHVFVDVVRTKPRTSYAKHAPFSPNQKQNLAIHKEQTNVLKLPPLVIKSPQHYEISTSIQKEVSRASKLHKQVYQAIGEVFSAIAEGKMVSVKDTETVAEGMVESIVRNPDALVWLAKMNNEDAYSYQHSVKASIWALVFGRHLGLDKALLKTLAMGVLLSHIGKAKLPIELLEQADTLVGTERKAYQAYVQHGVELLEGMNALPNGVVSIAKFHQERHNGSGFPIGVTGDRIPLLAKIAGLVDFYQELMAPRNAAQGLSPLDAVLKLYELRNVAFQQDLVERFIEAVGVYPTGTLVELSNHEVGIVTGHNLDRRLLPKLIVVLDEHKNPLKEGKVIDLKEWNVGKAGAAFLYIANSLPKGSYNINENEYLLTGAKSRWSWKHIAGIMATG